MRAFNKALKVVILLALIAAAALVYTHAQAISDWWALRGYSPPPAVSQLASQDTMSAYSKHVFYVNHPDIETDASQFRADCSETEKTIVLGCYHPNQQGIYLYDVTDPRLAGVMQVTAAHEMLHAAYDRLSSSERSYVDGLLLDYYNHDLHDQRIIDTMNSYKQSEPNDVVNEMHSVFGTEIANLPPALEKYYSRYFSDRHKITDYAISYENEFTSRESQIKSDDSQLAQMKSRIDAEEQNLQSQLNQINSDRARLDSLRGSGRVSQYNSQVDSFNAEVAAYNSGVQQLRADINAYNQLVATRNSIASELTSLDQSIDTRLTTQSSQ